MMLSNSFLGIVACILIPLTLATPHPCVAPQGLQYAAYHNKAGFAFGNPGYPAFQPHPYKKKQPILSGNTGYVGFGDTTAKYNPYGNSDSIKADLFVLNHRGYIKAPTTGNYTFSISSADDILEIWVGSLAYRGWTRANAGYEAASGGSPQPPLVVELNAGSYTPLRIMYANGGGDYSFGVTLTDPDGNVLLSGNSSPNDNIIQYGCNISKAPPYRPFGQET